MFPWLGYSPDGFHKLNNELMLLEVKCPVKGNTVNSLQELIQNLKYCEETSSGLRLKRKHPYYTQIQFGLLLCNLKLAKLVVLWRKNKSSCYCCKCSL